MSTLARRKNQNEGALKILTLSQLRFFPQQRSKLDSQQETHHVCCVFGYRQPEEVISYRNPPFFQTQMPLVALYASSVLPVCC